MWHAKLKSQLVNCRITLSPLPPLFPNLVIHIFTRVSVCVCGGGGGGYSAIEPLHTCVLMNNVAYYRTHQGLRSNFEIGGGGGTLVTPYWGGGYKTFFLKYQLFTILKILGEGGTYPHPLAPRSLSLQSWTI